MHDPGFGRASMSAGGPVRVSETCRIGPLTLDPDAGFLFRGSEPLPLGRRAVAVLVRLLRRPGEVVGKDALFDAAWPGLAVEDSNLTVQVSQIRRLLHGEVLGAEAWIETHPGRGYRFIGPAEWHRNPIVPPALPAHKPQPVENIPSAVPLHFVGRDAALAAIHAALSRDATGEAGQRPAIVALHGLRGIGKTILATTYARRHAAGFTAVWWIRAETEATMRADHAALAVRLGWADPGVSEDAACAAARLQMRRDGGGLLLIYDNAVDASGISAWLPPTGDARILVTSNAPAWRSYATPVELSLWPAAIGAEYLIARTGLADQRKEAEALSAALGGLPLAHEQAAATIENLGLGFADYADRFAATPIRLLDDQAHAPADYHDSLTVAKAFDLAIRQAAARHPAVEPLLRLAALLPPEPVPLFLFRDGRASLGEPLASALADEGLDAAVAVLRSFALVSREAIADERQPDLRTDCLRMHRLVREVAAARIPPADAVALRGALIAAMAAVCPPNVFNAPESWPRARRLDPLARSLVAPSLPVPPGAEAAAAVLLDHLGSFSSSARGALVDAHHLFERAVTLAEQTFGVDHPFTAQALNNLALALRDHGDLAAALPPAIRALGIRERVLGPAHSDTAVSLNNLANVLSESGDPAAARPLLERSLAIRRSVLGETHSHTAQALNNLARLLHQLGTLDESLELHRQALAIRETHLGQGHPDTANSMHNLGLLLRDLGQNEAALQMIERAVAVTESAFGANHPRTAAIRATQARAMLDNALLAGDDAAPALAVAERALAALTAGLAASAPTIATAQAIVESCRAAVASHDKI